jgi:triacylglycerol lipase
VWIGSPGKPTFVSHDGPALKGADNRVLAGVDHRETSFSPLAFAHAYRFITGREPSTTGITPQASVTLNGTLSGLGVDNQPTRGGAATNLPLAGAQLAVFRCDPLTGERAGPALLRKTIVANAPWGPLQTSGDAPLEFAITAAGYATTHIYRSPFPRSSSIVSLRAETWAAADRDAKALVVFQRPRGYFGVPRDRISLDGVSPPAGLPSGVAGLSSAKLKLADETPRTVVAEFNGDRIAARTWAADEGHVTYIELH